MRWSDEGQEVVVGISLGENFSLGMKREVMSA